MVVALAGHSEGGVVRIPPVLRHGPFTLEEARDAGLTRRQLQGDSWRRVARATYVWARLGETDLIRLRAAHRRLPAGAAFADSTAAWLHGLDLAPCDPIAAIAPRATRVSARGGIALRCADLGAADVVLRHGLPATSALRTATDLGRRLPFVEAVIALDMALHGRLVAIEELEAFLASHTGRPGIARLRRAVALTDGRAESPMETRLRLLLVQAGLPAPVSQVPLFDDAGGFLGRPDLLYPEALLAIEYDGGKHRESLVEDNRRQNRLLDAGYRLLRFTAPDVLGSPEKVVAGVRAALRSARFPGN